MIDAQAAGLLPIHITAVVSDKSACDALRRARVAGIPTLALSPTDFDSRSSFDRMLFGHIADFAPRLLVCAGYMRIISAEVVQRWHGRMINIHPSLLPKYAGLHTHRRALEAGDAEHGATTHFVTAKLDGGPRIAQVRLPIRPEDTAATLAARLLPLEHQLLLASIRSIACGDIALVDNGLVYGGEPLSAPMTYTSGELRPTLESPHQS